MRSDLFLYRKTGLAHKLILDVNLSKYFKKGESQLEPDDIFSTLYPAVPDNDDYKPAVSSHMGMSAFPVQTPLAMAYVPFQKFGNLLDEQKAFDTGTLFKDLNKPWIGSEGVMR